MNKIRKLMGSIGLAIVAAAVLLASTTPASADKLHLKDGRVLEGTVASEGEGYVFFTVHVGGIEQQQFFSTSDILKIERDDPADPSGGKGLGNKAAREAKPRAGLGDATRVAILNFGPPSGWTGPRVDGTVGIQISAKAFEDAVPMLEADGVDVVVVRINSGGGFLLEIEKFHKVFQEKYKSKFRTVLWVESAISAAAMAPWVIEEIYFMPQGNMGACTGWSGQLQAVKGISLESVLYLMEKASAMANRSPYIMAAMQILERPLSCTIDDNGETHWFQDLSGDIKVNTEDQILTFNAQQAIESKFAKGIASSKEELASVMGLQEVEFVGKRASDHIDGFMVEATRFETQFGLIYAKYQLAVQAASQLQGDENRQRRGAEVGRARRFLADMRRLFALNPNFGLLYGLDDEWFDEQERLLRQLAK